MRKTFIHSFEHWCLRSLELISRLLPRSLSLGMGSLMGLMLYKSNIYRHIVYANMAHTGYWTDKEIQDIMPRLYRTIGMYVADFLCSAGKPPPYTFARETDLERCVARGKGTIGVLAHLGNWEILANIFGKKIPDLSAIAMPMSNPAVEKWLHDRRDSTGIKTILKSHAVRPTLAALKRNGIVAILIDQYGGRSGARIPFLGKDSSTVRTCAGLLYNTDCSIVFGAGILQKDLTYKILFDVGRDLGISRDPEDTFIGAYLTEHNAVLSRWIREYPEHYFGWFHRRFKGSITY